jgi:hypothetical protein
MTTEFVGRFDPTAAQRTAASTQLAIMGLTSMGMEIDSASGNRFGRLL